MGVSTTHPILSINILTRLGRLWLNLHFFFLLIRPTHFFAVLVAATFYHYTILVFFSRKL